MPAYARKSGSLGSRERGGALAAVFAIQLVLGVVLLRGFDVHVTRTRDAVERLIAVTLAKPPPPPPPSVPQRRPANRRSAASAAAIARPTAGGSPGPVPMRAPPAVVAPVAIRPVASPVGGGPGTGSAQGNGDGGSGAGTGTGNGDGGSDLEQIAGEITRDDYPPALREAGVGGRVRFVFTVEPNGRVGRCDVTRSSGVPELDQLTCRLIQQRFRYRPSTDASGRPIRDEVEGQHDWVARAH